MTLSNRFILGLWLCFWYKVIFTINLLYIFYICIDSFYIETIFALFVKSDKCQKDFFIYIFEVTVIGVGFTNLKSFYIQLFKRFFERIYFTLSIKYFLRNSKKIFIFKTGYCYLLKGFHFKNVAILNHFISFYMM